MNLPHGFVHTTTYESRNIMDNNRHKGHRDRVKKRFVNEGLDAFEDHQVLELLLFYAVPQKDTNDLAHRMIDEFGSLAGLFNASTADISRRCGVSENTAILVGMIPSLARRYSAGKNTDKKKLNTVEAAGEHAASLFVGREYENFAVICLDSQKRRIHSAMVHEGTVSEVPVFPRLIVEFCLRHKAHSIFLAHNHPGGSATPSRDDIAVTQTIIDALRPIDIAVNDHFIVADGAWVSMKQQGYL